MKSPNHALQRTAPGGHAACSPQSPPRRQRARPPLSLSLGAFGVMRAVFALYVSFLLCAPTMGAEKKYGFMAGSDAELLAKSRDPEIGAVILGCVFRYEPPAEKTSKSRISHVTVIEAYKGKLAIGEKIVIEIQAEQGPTAEQELGKLRFYFLAKDSAENGAAPAKSFFCDWTDNLSYERYGEALRQLLRTQSGSRK